MFAELCHLDFYVLFCCFISLFCRGRTTPKLQLVVRKAPLENKRHNNENTLRERMKYRKMPREKNTSSPYQTLTEINVPLHSRFLFWKYDLFGFISNFGRLMHYIWRKLPFGGK